MSDYIKISDIPFRDLAEGHNTDIKVLVAFASDIKNLPTIEFNKEGEWYNKEIWENNDKGRRVPVEEWQCATCSVCGRYHITPYEYYFDDFNYCPNCGAKMKGSKNER